MSVRGAQDSVLLQQVVDDGLLLPVDPACEKQNDERERRRQRFHGATRALRGCRRARRATTRLCALKESPTSRRRAHWTICREYTDIVRSRLGGVFAHGGVGPVLGDGSGRLFRPTVRAGDRLELRSCPNLPDVDETVR